MATFKERTPRRISAYLRELTGGLASTIPTLWTRPE